MADADVNCLAQPEKILKDINDHNVDEDDSKANIIVEEEVSTDDSKANIIVEEEVSTGEIYEAVQRSNEPASKIQVGNEDQSDEEMPTCRDDTDEDVKEMNCDKETMEDLMSKLHINVDRLPLPTIGKQAKNGSSPLNNLRCLGRSTLLLFYRLWRDHLLKKPQPRPL